MATGKTSASRLFDQQSTPPNPGSNLYDVSQIRQEASESILKGAVTADYPLDLNQTIQLMNEALASEILCILRYRHHQIVAKGIDYPQVAQEFSEHANSEEQHMLMIAERIDQLGGDPDFNPASLVSRSATEYGSQGSLSEMIKQDLIAERVAIEVYRKIIDWFGSKDPTSRRIFEQILGDEEEHANDLANLLDNVSDSK
jgi:bacterioferritin